MKYKQKTREQLIEDIQKLEKFYERYIRLVENAKDMIYHMSLPDGKYEYVSPAAKEIFGYDPKVFIETPILIQEAIHPDFIQYFQDEWKKLLDGNMSPSYEYKIIHKSGEERWLNQRNVLIKDDSGNPIAIEGVVTDITQRKKTEIEKEQLSHDIKERRKELNCLYKISDYSFENGSIDEFITKVIQTIPPSFQYPHTTETKIVINSEEYKSKNYKPSRWYLKHDITTDGKIQGYIEINYQDEMPEHDEGPFLAEELDLINGIAELVGKTVDSKLKEVVLTERNEELKEKNEEYQSLNEEYLAQNEELQERNEEFHAINEELEEEIESRNKIQKLLQEQHDGYLTIFDNHPDALYVADPETYEVLFVNENFKQMIGEDPVGQKCYKTFQGFDEPCEFCTNDIIRKNKGKPYTWEYHNPKLNKDFYITDQMIKWPDGRDVRFELAVDITERKKAEMKLRESEAQFRSVFENSPLGKSMTGVNGGLRVNKAFSDILGYSEEELQHKKWEEITYPDDIKESENVVQLLLNGEEEKVHYEKRYIHKNGNIVYTDINTTLLKDEKDKPQYFITTISDITERKQIQFKLENTLKELERSNKELEQFAYVASHDLQEPLRKVKNFAELFAKKYAGALDEKADKYIYYMTSGADRMQNLIQDLLSYSRVATRGKEFVKTDLNNLINEVKENLQISIDENNIKIIHDTLPVIKADESQITQVFQNLLSNAIKFKSRNSPEIKISVLDRKSHWEFSVSDNGIGIDMQYKNKIFEVFQRLHSKEEYKGTGIGLAICKKIIERHKGKIWVDSLQGVGTTFYFTIPKKIK